MQMNRDSAGGQSEPADNLSSVRAIERFLARTPTLLIDGEWQPAASGKTIDIINPATGLLLTRSAEGDAADIDHAVSAARRSFDARLWRGKTGAERSRILWAWADLVDANIEELSTLEVPDNGMPHTISVHVVRATAEWIRDCARLAAHIFGRNVSGAMPGTQRLHAYTSSLPVGVVGIITPWNGPIITFALKVASALAASSPFYLCRTPRQFGLTWQMRRESSVL